MGEKQKKDKKDTGSDKSKKIPKVNEQVSFEKREGKFYNALDHEIRRTILRMVGKDGLSSFTQFKKTLKVSTGTLYHHLDVLKDLISQNESRKYILTNLGKRALNFLVLNYDSIEATNLEDQKCKHPPGRWFRRLARASALRQYIGGGSGPRGARKTGGAGSGGTSTPSCSITRMMRSSPEPKPTPGVGGPPRSSARPS